MSSFFSRQFGQDQEADRGTKGILVLEFFASLNRFAPLSDSHRVENVLLARGPPRIFRNAAIIVDIG